MESILFGCDVEEEKFRRSEWFFSMVATQLPAVGMKLIWLPDSEQQMQRRPGSKM